MNSVNSENIFEIKNLVKKFPEITAVNNISFSIPKGSCFGLLGPNGAGKTTTIEIIEGIQKASAGEILFHGKVRNKTFHEKIGIQFQQTELPQFLTVKETLELYRNLYTHRAPLDYLIEICKLDDILKFDNRKISGGQQQRLFLAMALANDPEVLFLDEPTTGLDPQARRHLWDIVSEIKKQGKTVLLTTHYMEEAQILCDRIAIIDHGQIIALDETERLLGEEIDCVSIILRNITDATILDGFPCPFYKIEDSIEIQTDDPEGCMKELLKRGVNLKGVNIRTSNLEDLFLKLTGKELRS